MRRVRPRLERRLLRHRACSECFDWFDRDMTLNERRVCAARPTCPISARRCVRYGPLGAVLRLADAIAAICKDLVNVA